MPRWYCNGPIRRSSLPVVIMGLV
ncbi:hypothetical protein BN381_80094 [Candidatus Microthrix parvicella RN1]|uniref:Uncharacterized protein n=1 Tax=Candidatus Neomicrothrix parvicella RN1 TaxID=1229780 RepID=R4Z3P4_9ACTN|nr:hypothetical protein BN381_80094 [Candidatus Microthrix parvicella RN1]